MGYDIHITRKENWADPHGVKIEFDEWSDIVELDDELIWDEVNDPSPAIWKVDRETRFWHRTGNISTKNPSREAIKKMFKIACELSAVVQGDEGELYDEHGMQQGVSVSQKKAPEIKRQPLSKWRRLLKQLFFGM